MIISSVIKCGISADSGKDNLHSNLKCLLQVGIAKLPDDIIRDEYEVDSRESSDCSSCLDSDKDVVMVDDDELSNSYAAKWLSHCFCFFYIQFLILLVVHDEN